MTPADWTRRWRDDADERAAIREYDGGQDRQAARAAAEREVREMARREVGQ